MNMRIRRILALLALASVVCATGCSTVDDLNMLEPGVISERDYAYPSLKDLWALTFNEKISECVDVVPVTEQNSDGSSERIGLIPFRNIVTRGMHRIVKTNFSLAREGEFPLFGFNAVIKRIVVSRSGNEVTCRLSLLAELVDNEEQRKPYFSKTYEKVVKLPIRKGRDRIVPDCVYAAVQESFAEVIRDIANDKYCVNHLNYVYRTTVLPKIKWPGLLNMAWTEELTFDGVSLGEKKGHVCVCAVAPNDMDAFRAFDWAKSRLAEMAAEKLGLPLENVRILYRQQEYNDAAKRWSLKFVTFSRQRVTISYSPQSRTGDAIADLALLHMDASTAAKHLEERVQELMNSRAGQFGDGAKANVRFYDLVTDEKNALVKISFKNVY